MQTSTNVHIFPTNKMKQEEPKSDEITEIVLVGLNHKTAPVELRECIAFSGDDAGNFLHTLSKDPCIRETILISTCNRVEIVTVTPRPAETVQTVKTMLGTFKNLRVDQFENALYIHQGDEAVRHLFKVASSLDSMIIGEPQILGQIKNAYASAVALKTNGVVINKLMHKTFSAAKRVRSETGIGGHAVSISYAAIELGKKIFGSLDEKKVLMIGAGEMAELAVEHLIRNRSGDIYVANRTFERGLELAERFKGKAVRLEEVSEILQLADIIISSTGAPGFVITKDQVKSIMRSRKNRPLFFIDIAVPRDIDPKINHIANCYVYDIDDLKGVIDENIEDRKKEALKAERIIDEAVIRFRQWQDSLKIVPTIVALRQKLESIAEAEIRKTMNSLSQPTDADREALGRMTSAMINKILHDPTNYLKAGCRGDKSENIDVTRKLFNLDSESSE